MGLLGTETWTLIVDSPGTRLGLSCEDAAAREVKINITTDEESNIQCNGNGLCHVTHPCEMSCKSVVENKKIKFIADSFDYSNIPKNISTTNFSNTTTTGKCGDTFWTSCDYNCTQSRLQASLRTDGICAEVSRRVRSCHKNACGRSDPCRVPFIVHAIFVFRKVQLSQWSKESEDVLIEALTKSVQEFASVGGGS